MTVHSRVASIDQALRAKGSDEGARAEKRYLKSDLQHYGVSVRDVRFVARDLHGADPDPSRSDVLALVEALWSVPVHERRSCAVQLLILAQQMLRAGDLAVLERLVRQSKTWALVDELAVRVVGPLVVRLPALGDELDRWAADEDFWVRRAALLSLLLPLRSGGGDFPRFARYADALLDEREFFIRKAIGWVLRDTSRRRPDLVYEWLLPRVHRASGVTLREAVKYLPSEQVVRLRDLRQVRASRGPGPGLSRTALP